MNNSKLKGIALTLVMLIAFTACALMLFSCEEEPTESVSLTYTETEDNITITGYDGVLKADDTLTIPSLINGKPVTAIANEAFIERTDLRRVFIPASVVKIGVGAFEDCKNLVSVNIPNRLTEIAESAFKNCENLASISLPRSVTTIGKYAFKNCDALATVTMPSTVTSIGDEAFKNCEIKTAEIPTWAIDTIETEYLESLTITGGDKIGSAAFAESENLTSVYIPESVTEIASDAFDGCTKITHLTVGGFALDRFELASLKSLNIIGSADMAAGMLADTKELAKLTIPFLGSSADGSGSTHFGYIFGASDASANDRFIPKSLTSVVITGGETVAANAFFGCSTLKSVILPGTIKTIGEDAFSGCINLENVNIPARVTSIGKEAFAETKMQEAVIPSGVTVVEEKVFYNCKNLKSLTIGENVAEIKTDAFNGCTALEELYIYSIENWCSFKFDTYYNNPLFYAANMYVDGKLIEELVIPECITEIADNTFFRLHNVKNIVLHDNITKIGDYAFTASVHLESINIPNSVVSIGASAFSDCDSLESIEIPASVTSIGTHAFNLCNSLTDVVLNASIDSIGAYMFRDCSSLTNLTVSGNIAAVDTTAFSGCDSIRSAVIPVSVASSISTRILTNLTVNGGDAITLELFKDAKALTSVVILDSVTTIDADAFAGCTALRSVSFSENSELTKIAEGAFEGCNKLTHFTLPAKVDAIGENAFNGCYSLVELTSLSDLVLTCGAETEGKIAYYAFGINASASDESNYIEDGELLFYDRGDAIVLIGYFGNKSAITLPASINDTTYVINANAFNGSTVRSLTIPAEITEIGKDAFANCVNLTELTAPVAVLKHIPANSLKTLVITDSTVIGADDLASYENLTTLTIPAEVTVIEGGALTALTSIETININAEAGIFKLVEGNLYSADETVLIRVMTNASYFTVPAGVKEIAAGAFSGCKNLSSIYFETDAQLTKIGEKAFANCDLLYNIEILAGVTEIGTDAFADCDILAEITVAEGNAAFKSEGGKLVNISSGDIIWELPTETEE